MVTWGYISLPSEAYITQLFLHIMMISCRLKVKTGGNYDALQCLLPPIGESEETMWWWGCGVAGGAGVSVGVGASGVGRGVVGVGGHSDVK